jgi:hypothetical protein
MSGVLKLALCQPDQGAQWQGESPGLAYPGEKPAMSSGCKEAAEDRPEIG